MLDEQAYTTFATAEQRSNENNRLQFLVKSMLSRQASMTLVLVRRVRGDEVDVQPMVSQIDGAGNAVPHGIIHGLPVWQLQGGTSAVKIAPVVGDIGLAIFASSDISNVKNNREPSTPGSFRRSDWADGIYLGGVLNNEPDQFIEMGPAGIKIKAADGLPIRLEAASVEMAADEVSISGNLTVSGSITGGAGSSFDGKAFDSHTHSGVQPGTGASGPPV